MVQTLQLRDAADQALGLVASAALFANIGTLGAHWRKLAGQITNGVPITDGPAFTRWLLAHLDDQSATALFESAGLTPLLTSLRNAKAQLGAILPGAEKLLSPLSAFTEVETVHTDLPQGWIDGADPGKVSFARDAFGHTVPVSSDLSVSFSISGALACEAGALWPFKGDGLGAGLLQVSASGALTAKTNFALPFAYGKLGAAVGAEARPGVHFFFDQGDTNRVFASALADDSRRRCAENADRPYHK
jgi:hypothetical protein